MKLQFQDQAKNLSFFKDSRDFSRGEKNSRVFQGFQGIQGSLATMSGIPENVPDNNLDSGYISLVGH